MTKKCEHCGKEFEAHRADAKYCSNACRKAASRRVNLMWNSQVIRGQHEGDIPPTGSGIIEATCCHCDKKFSRWMESKLARLVRNEIEGSVHWGSRDFDHQKFDELKAIRMKEVRYCSDECQKDAEGGYLNAAIPLSENPKHGDLYTEGEMQLEKGILRVRRRWVDPKKEVVKENGAAPKRRGS